MEGEVIFLDSILSSVKQALGIMPEYDVFDSTLIMHINSVFMILQQMGIGPEEGYQIHNVNDTWTGFIQDDPRKAMVKSYVSLQVRLMFDPPTSSVTSEAVKRYIDELEWRMKFNAEGDRLSDNK